MNFTDEETNMIGLYQNKDRIVTIKTLENISKYFLNDEMKKIAKTCIFKLLNLSDEQFDEMDFVMAC